MRKYEGDDYPLLPGYTELGGLQIERLQWEIAEEAIAIHRAGAASGSWRSPHDCWTEAKGIVLARRKR